MNSLNTRFDNNSHKSLTDQSNFNLNSIDVGSTFKTADSYFELTIFREAGLPFTFNLCQGASCWDVRTFDLFVPDIKRFFIKTGGNAGFSYFDNIDYTLSDSAQVPVPEASFLFLSAMILFLFNANVQRGEVVEFSQSDDT